MNTGDTKKDARSIEKLMTVHPELQKVIKHAGAAAMQFVVTEGIRTPERQRALYLAGASKTLKSKHLTGRAVDLAVVVEGEVRWDWPLYKRLAAEVKLSAQAVGVAIEWGGDWRTFPDGPHFQLADSVK